MYNIGYLYLLFAIITSVVSQIIIKWKSNTFINSLLPLPDDFLGKVEALCKIIFEPFVFTAMCLTFIAGLLWIATLTKLEISIAYPFTMLGFVAVLVLSALLFGEAFNIYKLVGCTLIVLGVLVVSKGL